MHSDSVAPVADIRTSCNPPNSAEVRSDAVDAQPRKGSPVFSDFPQKCYRIGQGIARRQPRPVNRGSASRSPSEGSALQGGLAKAIVHGTSTRGEWDRISERDPCQN